MKLPATSIHQEPLSSTEFPTAHHAATSPYTFAEFLLSTLISAIQTLYYNYTMIFYDPINFFLTVAVYFSLICAMSVVTIVTDILSKGKVIKYLSDNYGQGMSPVHWANPEMFDEGTSFMKAASLSFSKVTRKESRSFSTLGGSAEIQANVFDPHVAMGSLLLSALVYERDESSWPKDPNQRELTILKYAREWNLKFVKASEMKVKGGGPYCGVFVGRRPGPFIVVAFKGTSPFDSAEWLSDATITRTEASSYVYGEVHSGFFNKLFPQQNCVGKVKRSNPYVEILHCIQREALEFQTEGEPIRPIPLWITGHSLGGALASLFYARLIKSIGDLGYATTGLVLQDGYTYGCPALGDGRFASEFASFSNLPYSNHSTLWRVVNDADIVTRIPPGNDDLDTLRFFSSSTLMNYAHIGQSLRLFTDGSNPDIQPTRYSSILYVANLDLGDGVPLWLRCYHFVKGFLPIGLIGDFPSLTSYNILTLGELLVPKLVADHFTSRYFWSLKRLQQRK
ncbi:alpha/beta-hydrolase [Basidiobolus meristosporus CBS 931.73]|uniref:Alpha/beta-hydrolase n=1 Tax=Basidiobolus meristosporus CBS 931.73 TaxID=1314790 RepID=A0A1Y1XZD8_9FUNG|nr:alpha/beta-hydrolase [Basidiobolus meristosporus CBS 931.73]|eukprot:ORX91098.1 alpha/beta-hydrolase [Basidiobolus meristosporus CBS 931.73]